ncbi:hypothetical protein FRX31_020682 [Thalictrum thalictroides]|uniref:Uncharacterized protein n=1 Tax=Thalictrum thalictroides TaxID=46969 RepID=A0A7J6VY11_THATH|nr:hypothetical protein FRX31_020682 [Thalictrum thalictroides]
MADCIELKDREMAKKILMIALSCVEFWAFNRPSMKDVVRLLEGTKEPQMPPNHFLSSLQASSNAAPNRNLGVEVALVKEEVINISPREKKAKVRISSEIVSFGDHEEEEKVYGDKVVAFKQRIVKPDDHQHGQSYLPLFTFSLILILYLKFYFD